MKDAAFAAQEMPQDQLLSLLAKLREDTDLREKLQGAADLDAALALAQDAGCDVSKADWLDYQARQQKTLQLSDEELESMTGAGATPRILITATVTNDGAFKVAE